MGYRTKLLGHAGFARICIHETLHLFYFKVIPMDGPARGQSVSLSHTLAQVEVIPLTLDLMPSWHRWLFGALSIEIHSSLR